jgi:hypothetical protein
MPPYRQFLRAAGASGLVVLPILFALAAPGRAVVCYLPSKGVLCFVRPSES